MRCRTSSRILVISMVSVVMLSAAGTVAAQCDGPKRPPKPVEAKTYADGYALFQRMAPPPPAGFTATDSNTSGISFGCAGSNETLTRWSFSRTFNRSEAEMQTRGNSAMQKTQAVTARAEERRKAKEARLADLDRRQADLAKRGGAHAFPALLAAGHILSSWLPQPSA
jgi:hypothetical protein